MGKYPLFTFDHGLLVALLSVIIMHWLKVVPSYFEVDVVGIVAIIATIPVIFSALKALVKKQITVDLLGSIALIATILAGDWPSAVFINLMITCARVLDVYTEYNTRNSIESLLKLRPAVVKVLRDKSVVEIKVEEIKVGDRVVIESGGRIPIDGKVESGDASVDQSSLTGESVPVAKTIGDQVLSSTLVTAGSLTVIVEKVGKDTALEKIIELVKNSQKGKAGIYSIANKFATWYIIGTVVGSAIIYYFWRDYQLLLAILLVACADDIAVGTPLAFLTSIGYAAKRGIIIKGGNYLEILTKAKNIVVDKTGTLTKGKLNVQKVFSWSEFTKEDVARYAAITEFYSHHPAAKAIIDYVQTQALGFIKPNKFKEYPGQGTTAMDGDKKIILGKYKFLIDRGVKFTEKELGLIVGLEADGYNVAVVGLDEVPVGVLCLADEIRPEIKSTIAKLKKQGLSRWVMLTGDNDKVAGRVAKEVGIKEYYADLLPEDKVRQIKQIINPESKTVMVGDGVNDAASLALADVGIAMGVIGSDTAIEAADIALMQDNFEKINEAVEIGKRTMRIIKQNFIVWGAVNLIGFGLIFGGIIGPQGAAAYNFLTDFLPLFNSLRLMKA